MCDHVLHFLIIRCIKEMKMKKIRGKKGIQRKQRYWFPFFVFLINCVITVLFRFICVSVGLCSSNGHGSYFYFL